MKDLLVGFLGIIIGLGGIYGVSKWSETNKNWDKSTTRYLFCKTLTSSELDPITIKINIPDRRWFIEGHTPIKWDEWDWDESIRTGDEIDVSETIISLSKQYESFDYNCMDCDPVAIKEEWQLNRITLRLNKTKTSEVESLSINYQCRKVEPL